MIYLILKKTILEGYDKMAKPIGETPTLYGKDALNVIKKMNEPPTEDEVEFAKKIKSQRNVPF